MPSADVRGISRLRWRTPDVLVPLETDLDDVDAGGTSFNLHVAVAEARASSAIEGIYATVPQIFLALLDPDHQLVTAEGRSVAANVRAVLDAANGLARYDDHRRAHDRLMEGQGTAEHAGGYRTHGVTVGGNLTPAARRVPELMDDLIAFVSKHPNGLVASAIAHAQFETIHPYPDGNGRIGRALLAGMLGAPVSVHLARDRGAYYDALRDYRLGDATPICVLVGEAAQHGRSWAAEGFGIPPADESSEAAEALRLAENTPVGTKARILGDALPAGHGGFDAILEAGLLRVGSEDLGDQTVYCLTGLVAQVSTVSFTDVYGTQSLAKWERSLRV